MDVSVLGLAPEFPGGLRWLRCERPWSFGHELAGKVVVLHFWTASCVHSRLDLGDLALLQQVYAGEPVAIVGVHVGRFARERWPANIELAVRELGIAHPVVVDDSMQVWRAFGCAAWPTLALIDAKRRIRFHGSGRIRREALVAAVGSLLRELPQAPPTEPVTVLPQRGRATTELAHPAKCAVDPARGLLWISDTAHHRILAFDTTSGVLRHQIGSGLAGASDGPATSAAFCAPRGLCVDGGRLWIADTGNALVRVLDVASGDVTTVLGTNRHARDLVGGKAGTEQDLCAPSDLVVDQGELLIAMTGTHQLWRMDTATRIARPFAGTGVSGCRDGDLVSAHFAEPAGLALRGRELAVVDAATSAVRVIDLDTRVVRTRVGKELYRFGDLDGPCEAALLQQPLSIAWHGRDLLVADTLNGKVKRVAAESGRCETILGPIALGSQLTGIAVAGDTLWVCDGTDHRMLRADLTESRVASFPLQGIEQRATSAPATHEPVGPILLSARGEGTVRLELSIPPGERVHPDAPIWAEWEGDPGGPLARPVANSAELEGTWARVWGVPLGEPGEGTARLRVRYLTCRATDGVVHVHEILRLVRIQAIESGPDAATI